VKMAGDESGYGSCPWRAFVTVELNRTALPPDSFQSLTEKM
jgi:hypothetical protein